MNTGNIGASEQRRRLFFGVMAVMAAVAWVASGRASSLSGAAVLFVLFWFGVLGILQGKQKT